MDVSQCDTNEGHTEQMTKKTSRAQWMQIAKRVRLANFQFDKNWKCLVCGFTFQKCEHTHSENQLAIEGVKSRFEN